MAFHAFPFLLGFLPLALGGFAVCARLGVRCGVSWAKAWLLAVSILFYALANPHHLPLLLLLTIGNGLLLHVMSGHRHASRLATIGIIANLAILAGFKLAEGLSNIGLPLGLSFYTFAQITCLLAAADGAPIRTADHALFSLFFPVVAAGPVLNARDNLGDFQRSSGWRLTVDDLAVGSGCFLIGLLKKNLLSDPLGAIVAAGFGDAGAGGAWSSWQAAASWSLQLYFDFSGYSDMATGLGRMFGIRVPDNFNQPYRARSVIDYWQRWHMSLTRFLTNHVHAPLALAALRRRRARNMPIGTAAQKTPAGFLGMIAAPILVTMLAAGLWHGLTWTYLAFGVMHGLFLVINHAARLWRAPRLPPALSVALTYACVLAGGVVFRAETLDQAAGVLAGMAGWHGFGVLPSDLRGLLPVLWIVALHGVIWLAPTTRGFMTGTSAGWLQWQSSLRWGMALGCAGAVGLLASGGTQEFVYFSF